SRAGSTEGSERVEGHLAGAGAAALRPDAEHLLDVERELVDLEGVGGSSRDQTDFTLGQPARRRAVHDVVHHASPSANGSGLRPSTTLAALAPATVTCIPLRGKRAGAGCPRCRTDAPRRSDSAAARQPSARAVRILAGLAASYAPLRCCPAFIASWRLL